MSTEGLTQRRIGVDRFYTNLSIGIAPDQEFIGDQVLPVLMTQLSRELLLKFGKEAWVMKDDLVGDFAMPARIDLSLDKLTVEVDGHALEQPISDRYQLESIRGPAQLDLEARAMYILKQRMLLRREYLQAALVQTGAAYTAVTHDINLSGAEWDTDKDPLDDILPITTLAAPQDSGRTPNVFWMGAQVWAKLIQNKYVRNRIFGLNAPQGVPLESQFAALIGVQKVLVGRSITRTAAGTPSFVWGKNAGLVYVPPVTGAQIPAFGYTVEQAVFGSSSEAVNRIRDEHMGASGGWYLKRSHFYTPAITFQDAGFLFENAVQ